MSDVYASLGREGVRNLLTSALDSLYKDRIKPVASYVRGRLKERSASQTVVKVFVELYTGHPDMFVVQQSTGTDEATILFATEPDWFKGWVDIDSSEDPYSEEMWSELKELLDSGDSYAGGRYGMARDLSQKNLAFLAHNSLGEICHIVQLAIQKRKLIVYHRKMLKPVQANLCQTSAGTEIVPVGDLDEIKDLDQLCKVLFRMLVRHPQGIRLDRMKQTLKHDFSCQLNEMRLQCTKLIELFRQEPLQSSFALENDGKAFYVRSGDASKFSEHVRGLYSEAMANGAKQVEATDGKPNGEAEAKAKEGAVIATAVQEDGKQGTESS